MRSFITYLGVAMLALLLVMVTGCEKTSDDSAKEPQAKEKTTDMKDAKSDKLEKTVVVPNKPVQLAGSHILIAYKGGERARPTVTRTKEEAKALADDLSKKINADSTQFEELAKKNSDCPSAANEGDLGSWKKGMMTPAFDDALLKLKNGEFTKTPIETPFGFHIIRRNGLLPQEEVSALHIIISHKDANRVPPGVTRTKAEAKTLAEDVLKQAKAAPDTFKKLAEKHSNNPKPEMGPWMTGTSGMPKPFDQAMLGLKIGEISPLVETGFGYHIFLRTALPEKMAASHILIMYKGLARTPGNITRTRDEAKKLADDIVAKAKANPKDFGKLVTEFTDDPTAKMNNGDLGEWYTGAMVPEFEAAAKKLAVGQISDAVESPFGFHIILKQAVKSEKAKPATK